MDYRELLVKYMAHVIACESVTYIGDTIMNPFGQSDFTDEEWAELQQMAREARSKR